MTPQSKRIALLGATSHIARGLVERFARHAGYSLHLYARSAEKVRAFYGCLPFVSERQPSVCTDFELLVTQRYDAVINCIGVGTHKKLQGEYYKYFTVTEQFDNLILRYLADINPDALYISLSSGAVYGRSLSAPASDASECCFRPNQIAPADYYSLARLNAEAKHRALAHLNIADLRIFSYFSRHIDLGDGYFITDVINSILQNRVLETDGNNIVRDYVHPDDLFAMVVACLEVGRINAAYDVISSQPVEKQQILDYFSSTYGLEYVVRRSAFDESPTGFKHIYCSECRNAGKIGYRPRFSSLEALACEACHLLLDRGIGGG